MPREPFAFENTLLTVLEDFIDQDVPPVMLAVALSANAMRLMAHVVGPEATPELRKEALDTHFAQMTKIFERHFREINKCHHSA